MKRENIEKLLKENGVADDKLKAVVDTIMNQNGNDIENYKTAKEQLETQLKTANDTLDKFKDVDVDGLKGEVQKYKDDLERVKTENKAELERMQFGHILDGALRTAGAKNSKAVMALLDNDGLKLNGESIVGLDEQISKIKEENGYLFEDDKTPQIVRTSTGNSGGTGEDDGNKTVNSAIRSLLGKE